MVVYVNGEAVDPSTGVTSGAATITMTAGTSLTVTFVGGK